MLRPNGSWSVTCIELWYQGKGSRVWSSVLVSVDGWHGHVSEEMRNSVCGELQVSSVQDAGRGQCNDIQWNNSGENEADLKILCGYWQWDITIPKQDKRYNTLMKISTRTGYDERNELDSQCNCYKFDIKHCGQMSSTPALNSGGTSFKSWSEDLLWLKILMLFFSPSRKSASIVPKISYSHFLQQSFPFIIQ